MSTWVAIGTWVVLIGLMAVRDHGLRVVIDDLSADLDDSNRVVDEQAVLLSHIVDHLNDAPGGGKHAHTNGDTVNQQ